MLQKMFQAEVKARGKEDGATQPGEFSAVVAVYDNVDRAGDRIKAGAFDETLAAWRKSGDPIPVVLAHQWDDPFKHIGYADPADVKSVPGRGLVVEKAVLDIDDNPIARQVHRLMERKTLKEFSFGYTVNDGGERKADDGAYDLTSLNLIEFGPCLKGVNEETELLAIKAEVEAERRKSDEPTLEERLTRVEAALAGKAYVEMVGTYEARMQSIREALDESYGGDKTYVSIEGTADDVVTYCVYDMAGGERKTFQSPYSLDEEGNVTLGEAKEVEIEAVVVPKSEEDIEKKARDEEEAYAENARRDEEARRKAEDESISSADVSLMMAKAAVENQERLLSDVVNFDEDLDTAQRKLDSYEKETD